MVTNHLRAPYGVYFTKNRTILRRPYGARPAAGRILLFFIIVLDIVQCPLKFRHYLKFHGARTAFGRVIEGTMTSAGHLTAPVWLLHTSDYFCSKFKSYDSNGDRHRTMSDKRKELYKTYLIKSGHRPDTGRCFVSRTATGEKRRVFAEVHIASS